MSRRRAAVAALAALSVAACATPPLPPPTASLDNIQAARRGEFASLSVGAFTPGPGAPTAMDRKIDIRAGSQPAPKSSRGSYAQYLADTLAAELSAAGRLDPASPLVVSGVITDAHVDSAMPVARARLAARFTLRKDGAVVFEKDLAAQSEWKSSLIGAVAIPDPFNHYLGLFPDLAGQLLRDPGFKTAAKR